MMFATSPTCVNINSLTQTTRRNLAMNKYQAITAIKFEIEKLEDLFDQMIDGVVEASNPEQQKVIDRLDHLGEMLKSELGELETLWGVA